MRKDSFIETITAGKILVSDNKYLWLPVFLLFHYLFRQQTLPYSLATARVSFPVMTRENDYSEKAI